MISKITSEHDQLFYFDSRKQAEEFLKEIDKEKNQTELFMSKKQSPSANHWVLNTNPRSENGELFYFDSRKEAEEFLKKSGKKKNQIELFMSKKKGPLVTHWVVHVAPFNF